MRRLTIVVRGGDVGAAFAMALGVAEGIASLGYWTRRDGCVEVTGLTTAEDKGARKRWVARCKREGLAIVPAPWERKAKVDE